MEIYRFFGVLAVMITIAGLWFLAARWPQGLHTTFSQHAAAQRFTIIYYILLFTIVLPLLVLFFVGWFVPYFGLSVWFSFCVIAAVVTQYTVTLIPEVGGWKTRWHRAITFVSILCLLLALTFILVAPTVGWAGKLLVVVGLAVMVGIMAYLAAVRGKHKYLLLFQAGYYAAFLAPVLFIAYFNFEFME